MRGVVSGTRGRVMDDSGTDAAWRGNPMLAHRIYRALAVTALCVCAAFQAAPAPCPLSGPRRPPHAHLSRVQVRTSLDPSCSYLHGCHTLERPLDAASAATRRVEGKHGVLRLSRPRHMLAPLFGGRTSLSGDAAPRPRHRPAVHRRTPAGWHRAILEQKVDFVAQMFYYKGNGLCSRGQ